MNGIRGLGVEVNERKREESSATHISGLEQMEWVGVPFTEATYNKG